MMEENLSKKAVENGAAGIIFESKNLKKNLNLSIPNIVN